MQKPKINRALFVASGRRGGLIGGKVRASRLTKERRREIAILANRERWKNHIKKEKP